VSTSSTQCPSRAEARRAEGSQGKKPLSSGFVSGSDGTRTRDLRRDRPAF
jgi:hypothetical protein